MAQSDAPAILDALEDFLERERGLILAGDLDRLGRLLPHKADLLERLQGTGADPAALDRLRNGADRNQRLLSAAARGIRSVTRRLQGMKDGQARFTTYDPTGMRQPLAQGPFRLERRR